MNENSIFEIKRAKFLLIHQLKFSTQGLLIGFGVVIGIIVFNLSMKMIFGNGDLSSNMFFGIIMPFFYVGGYIFTSTIFSELGNPQRGYLYLILPASTFEKLIIAWLITAIMYVTAAVSVMFIINLFLVFISSVFSLNHITIINLFDPVIVKSYTVYLVTQPIFILGAIFFKRVHFLKTLLAIFVISLIIAIYTAIAARIIVFPHSYNMQFNDSNIPENVQNFFLNIFAPTMKILFWFLLAPFCLIVSYFRLKEREV